MHWYFQVYAYYEGCTDCSNTLPLATIVNAVAAAFGGVSGAPGDPGKIYNGLSGTLNGGFAGAAGSGNNALPAAYLNMITFNNNLDVPNPAELPMSAIPITTSANMQKQKLTIGPITIPSPGYVYIYVNNNSNSATQVYFDDLKVTQLHSPFVAGADFYPFGLTMSDREITTEPYRFGYQGQYSEEENETGWNSFDLRMYDARIGRFTTPDPYNEFHSSYVGMGNRPHMTTDPTGGFTGGTTLLNEVVITASRLPSISSVVGSIAGVAARGLMIAAITSSFSPPDDIYFKNGKEDRRIVNDQPDRYFELTPNSEFTTGYEAIEMANPNVNPSGVMYNNVSGYVYNALDIKIRNILMAKHGPTSTYIKGLEAQGNFQPLHSKNYLQYYEQKYHTRSSFYYGLENYYGPGYADVSFSGLQGARGMMRASPRTFYPRVNSVRPSLSLNPQIKNPWNQFLNATQGKYVGPNAMKQAAHDFRLWRMGKF